MVSRLGGVGTDPHLPRLVLAASASGRAVAAAATELVGPSGLHLSPRGGQAAKHDPLIQLEDVGAIHRRV